MNKLLNPFQKPSAALLARAELEEAKRQLLAAQTALEYAQSMVTYNESKVKRLTAYLKKESTE
jgi:hypothetical protein